MVLFQGLADAAIIGTGTEAYFNLVSQAMSGPDQTEKFIRYYEFPGMDHCRGGVGLNHADLLSALEQWAEENRAPEQIIGYHMDLAPGQGPVVPPVILNPSAAAFSRPVYPYPDVAEFIGGDWTDAKNYQRQSTR